MNISFWKNAAAVLALATTMFAPQAAQAQTYPDHVVKIVVPFAAGATTDVMARLVANKMQDDWKVPVIIENKAGASGLVGAQMVTKSTADGYTLILVTDHHVSLPNMFRSVTLDPVKDFTPVMMMGRAPNVFVVNSVSPIKTIQELVETARAKPGTLSYGSAGLGGSNHMTAELFKQEAKLDILHIPYKGGAPNATAIVSNEVPMSVSLLPTIEGFVKTGQVRALAISSAERHPLLPNVPTLAESGFRGFETYEWWAMLGPPGMPKEVVDKLNAELVKVLNLPDIRDKFDKIGVEYGGPTTPEQTRSYMAQEMERWTAVAKNAGMKAE
jgi:tripartite-type tricarboxylate transporter receptor subunit TctC